MIVASTNATMNVRVIAVESLLKTLSGENNIEAPDLVRRIKLYWGHIFTSYNCLEINTLRLTGSSS